MAVVYRTSLKSTRMSAVVTDIGTTGKLIIGTAGMASTLATISLSNPAGTVLNGFLTFSGTPLSATAGNTGTAAEAKITDGTNDIITGLTVSTTGANINLSSVGITSGDTVTITSASITHG